MSIKLFPCPFCGCNECDYLADSDSQAAAIYCKECPGGVQHVGYTEQQIADAWNDRSHDRITRIVKPLDEGFDLCVSALAFDAPRKL